MSDLASIYQRVLDAVGERARVTRDGEQLQWHATYGHWCYVGHIVATRSHPTDAANAIAVHWLLMLYASYKPADMTAVTRFAPEPPMLKDATIGELIESLAERVIRECKP